MNKLVGVLTAVMTSGAMMKAGAQTKLTIETNFGDIPVVLFDAEAPNTVENFLSYVENGDYTNAIFHRMVAGFVLQSGGYQVSSGGTYLLEAVTEQDSLLNEFNISNTKGTLAMAKVGGDPDSATSQWFINLGDNSANLDNQNGGFTVFGEVEDFTVVDEIVAQNIVNGGGVFTDLPVVAEREDGSEGPLVIDDVEAGDLIQIKSISIVDSLATVPEPSSTGLLLVGSMGFVLRRRR